MSKSYSHKILVISLIVLIVSIGYFNYAFGHGFNLFPLYLIPLAIAAWKENLPTTIFLSILAGIAVILKISLTEPLYVNEFFWYWDGLVKFFLLITMSYGLWKIKDLIHRQDEINLELRETMAKIKWLNESLAATNRELEELNSSLEVRIVKAVDELRQKDKILILKYRQALMGEMINNIAHQWRQPLNTLGLVVQQVLLYYDSNEFSKEFVKKNTAKAMQLIQHMSRTIDDFRNFFRSDKEVTIFDVNQVIAQALSFIEKSLEDQDVRIVFNPEGAPMANGYPNEYAQVILNILINARDALTAQNVEDALISIHAFSEGGKSVVTITDNAGGIAEEILNKIFDPYFTTKGPDKGTGIGLYMSKTIIDKNMGGLLTVRNTGSGAEFRIEV